MHLLTGPDADALGRIDASNALKQRVHDQREEITNTSATHAVALARWDPAAAELRMLSLTDVLTGLYTGEVSSCRPNKSTGWRGASARKAQ